MAEWLGHWTCNAEVPRSSLPLESLGLVYGSPMFKSSAALVNSKLVSLQPVGVFKIFVSFVMLLSEIYSVPS